MSKQMAFNIFGVGYSGVSGGEAWLAFSGGILYHANCQGTSGSMIYTAAPFDICNDLSNGRNDTTLVNFSRSIAHLSITQSFVGSGFVSVTFEIFDQGSNTPAYRFERPNVRVGGVSFGSIDIRREFNLHPRTDTSGIVWSRIWGGHAVVSAALGR